MHSPIKDNVLTQQAIALWLIDNTSLTFKQIADFCAIHEITVQAIADGEINTTKINPVAYDLVDQEEILKCQENPSLHLASKRTIKLPNKPAKSSALTKLNAAAWVMKQYNLNDKQIGKLLRLTAKTVESIRNGSHRLSDSIVPTNPIDSGLLTTAQITEII